MKKLVVLSLAVVMVAMSGAELASAATGYGGTTSGSRSNKRTAQAVTTPAPQVLGTSTFQFATNLSEGMTSNDVKELQERLRAEGFFTFPTSTGYFGPITRAAVIAYQQAKGITPAAGFVGPITRASLNK